MSGFNRAIQTLELRERIEELGELREKDERLIAVLTAEHDAALEQLEGMKNLHDACKSYFSQECGIDAYGQDAFCQKCAQAEPCKALAALSLPAPTTDEALRNVLGYDEQLRRIYLTNAVVYHALNSGGSLRDCLVALADAYECQGKQLERVIATMPPSYLAAVKEAG